MSYLDQPRTPVTAWLSLAAFAVFFLGIIALNSCDGAEPPPSRVSTSLFAWKLFVVDHDGQAYRRGGDLFGGRAIASIELSGGLHLGLRGDASALTNDFDLKNPGTWRSLEGYAALSRPFVLGQGWTAGPAVMAGALVPVTTEASWASRPTWGGGARLSFGRSWAYALVGTNGAADERWFQSGDRSAGGSPVRFLGATQIELKRFAIVGDLVSGPGGFARGGLAFRVPLF